MKKLIRHCAFECNSSSSHVIVMALGEMQFVLDTIYPNQDGKIYVRGNGQFGWEWIKYNDAQTKLQYAFQDHVDEELLREVVKEQTGAEDVIFIDSEDGYIDHQSCGTVRTICTDKESTRDFIFNKNSWLFTGNDNSSPDPTFFDVPEIRDGKIIVPKYKYELVIDGLKQTTKFKHFPDKEELECGIDSLVPYGTLITEGGYFIDDNSIHWQLTRPRNEFYIFDHDIDTDFENEKIFFVKEHDQRSNEIRNKYPYSENQFSWEERHRLIQEEMLATPGLVISVSFKVKPIE